MSGPETWKNLLKPVHNGKITMPHPASSGTGFFDVTAWLQRWGKLTRVETFRVGCISAIGRDEMRHAVNAVRDALADLGISQVASSGTA